MMQQPKGYTTLIDVEDELHLVFDGDQSINCERLIIQAERVIERTTGRTWTGGTSQAVSETQLAYGGYLSLRNLPVISITSMVAAPDAWSPTTLIDASSYVLADPNTGAVRLAGFEDWTVTVHYVYDSSFPADLTRAATLLVSSWMRPSITGVDDDVLSYSVGGELTVTRFARTAKGTLTLPPEVERILSDLAGAAGLFA